MHAEIGQRKADEAVTYWEKVAETQWGRYISEIEKNTLLKAHRSFAKPSTAIEVGCEGGRWTKLLSESGWNMIATDVNPDVLSLCQARVPATKCILVSKTDTTLPCDDETVDMVVAIEPDVAMQSDWILPEANRVLRDGGIMVSVIWNNMSWRGIVPHWKCRIKGTYDYYTYSYPEWKNRFHRSGFRIIYAEGMCWMPFGRSSNSALIPFFTNMEKMLGLRKLTYLSPWISLIAKKR